MKLFMIQIPSKSKMVMKFAMGTARFTSGKFGLVNKNNIDIQTPTASIGIKRNGFYNNYR